MGNTLTQEEVESIVANLTEADRPVFEYGKQVGREEALAAQQKALERRLLVDIGGQEFSPSDRLAARRDIADLDFQISEARQTAVYMEIQLPTFQHRARQEAGGRW